MKTIYHRSFAFVTILATFSLSCLGLAINGQFRPEAVSVGNLTEGPYWIQSASNSSVLIGAFKNGYMVPGPGYVHPENVSAEQHDPDQNVDIEHMLLWYVSTAGYDPAGGFASAEISTYGTNFYNIFDWYDMGTMFPIRAEWLLVDVGNNRTMIRAIDFWGTIFDACLTESGLGNDLEQQPCDENNIKQLWHFVPLSD